MAAEVVVTERTRPSHHLAILIIVIIFILIVIVTVTVIVIIINWSAFKQICFRPPLARMAKLEKIGEDYWDLERN